ncbi:hypothetical protein POG22_15695 [Geitlerinema sp. CS-897]|uniref:hypothetical protein n=1 Tax=Baaleninema simplex TaxID=2862350 RepID=UPI00034BA7A6|nr:hypothetical protein [Baaleninema simplex]MDC0834431.1 hypothetical protein [Geitlerinema sp. CS-897]
MKPQSCPISTCRSCRYYTPEGRRGGQCQQLGAPVCGGWKACSLGFPPFAPSWEYLEKSMTIVSHEAVLHDIIHEEKRPIRVKPLKSAV